MTGAFSSGTPADPPTQVSRRLPGLPRVPGARESQPAPTWAVDPPAEPFCLAIYPSAFHSVMFNPVEPRLIATANSKEGVGLWDIRKPRRSDRHRLFGPVFQTFPSAAGFFFGGGGCRSSPDQQGAPVSGV